MVYVGRFNEEQIKNGEEKKAIKEKQEETGLKYVETKIIYKNKKPIAMDYWVCTAEEFTIDLDF